MIRPQSEHLVRQRAAREARQIKELHELAWETSLNGAVYHPGASVAQSIRASGSEEHCRIRQAMLARGQRIVCQESAGSAGSRRFSCIRLTDDDSPEVESSATELRLCQKLQKLWGGRDACVFSLAFGSLGAGTRTWGLIESAV